MAGFNIDPNISLGIKPQQAMSLGDMVNLARGVQAYGQAQQYNPLVIRQQQAETELAEKTLEPKIQQQQSQTELAGTQSKSAKFKFSNEMAQVVQDEATALSQDPRIIKATNDEAGRQGAVTAILAAKKRAIARGVDEHMVEAITAPYMNAAVTDPTIISQELKNATRGGEGAVNQASQIAPAFGSNAYNQTVVRNAATGEYELAGSPQTNPRNAYGESKTDALGRQWWIPYNADGTPGTPQLVGTGTTQQAPAQTTQQAPTAPINVARNKEGGALVAADVNNPSGIKANGKFVEYKTPAQGVRATQNLVSQYLSGEGAMAGVKTTPENVVGMWVNGKPETGNQVMNGAYVKAVKQELDNVGVKLNQDGTIPDTPLAIAAVTTAKIKMEAGKNADKFLGAPTSQTTQQAQPGQSFVQPSATQTPESIKSNINTGYNNYREALEQQNNPNSKTGHIPTQLFNDQNILRLLKDSEVDTSRIANYFSDPLKYKFLTAKEQDLAKYLEQRVQGLSPSSVMDLQSKHQAYGTTALKKEALNELIRNEYGSLTSKDLLTRGRINAAGSSDNPNSEAVNKFDKAFAVYAKDPVLMKYIGIVGEGAKAHLDQNDINDISKIYGTLANKDAIQSLELKRQALLKLVNGGQ